MNEPWSVAYDNSNTGPVMVTVEFRDPDPALIDLFEWHIRGRIPCDFVPNCMEFVPRDLDIRHDDDYVDAYGDPKRMYLVQRTRSVTVRGYATF